MGTNMSYDERPDPGKPGQQGVLFRRVAPAMDQNKRNHLEALPQSSAAKQRGHAPEMIDTRTAAGRVRGIPGELYHGTAAKLKPGSLIRPGQRPNWGLDHSHDTERNHAFATPEMHEAFRYANHARESGNWNTNYARPHVYRVEPTGPVQSDHEDSDSRSGNSDTPMAYQSHMPFRVLHEVQFKKAREEYAAYHEEELGDAPGDYPYAQKTPEQRHQERHGY